MAGAERENLVHNIKQKLNHIISSLESRCDSSIILQRLNNIKRNLVLATPSIVSEAIFQDLSEIIRSLKDECASITAAVEERECYL